MTYVISLAILHCCVEKTWKCDSSSSSANGNTFKTSPPEQSSGIEINKLRLARSVINLAFSPGRGRGDALYKWSTPKERIQDGRRLSFPKSHAAPIDASLPNTRKLAQPRKYLVSNELVKDEGGSWVPANPSPPSI
jgi:hypothetical protein